MHEMSLTESVVEILAEEGRRQGFARVKKVWLEIGALSGVEPEAMDLLLRRGRARHFGGRRDARRSSARRGRAGAWTARRTVALAERFGACPECGGGQVQMTAGDEMRVKELEVE